MAREFVVLTASSPEDVYTLLALCKKEVWRTIGKYDVELFFAADPNGLFTGYVAGEKVSYLNMVTYGDSDEHCIFGSFIVSPEHRTLGYGSKIWEYAWSKIPKSCAVVSVTATIHMAPKFKKYGFKHVWTDYMFVFDAKETSSLPVPANFTVISYKTVDFCQLLSYDTSVFGYARKPFLEKMLALPEFEGWVALDEDGEIIGCCGVRESVVEKYWILGPWYANNAIVAQLLLVKAAEFISSVPEDRLVCVVPGINQQAMKLARSLKVETSCMPRMFAKSTPEAILINSEKRVFGTSSTVVG